MWPQRSFVCSPGCKQGVPRIDAFRSSATSLNHNLGNVGSLASQWSLLALNTEFGKLIWGPSRAVNRLLATAKSDGEYDLVLSSGFLAFANHSGFLQAVDEAGLGVGGVMGTSAGALAGSLYAAGYSPEQVARELSRTPPIQLLRPAWQFWRGGFISLDAVVERLRELLPPTFEDLETDFAVGVVTRDGRHIIIDSGPLPEAVAASAAIPILFAPVHIPGAADGPFKDGGIADRIGLKIWRQRRRSEAGGDGDEGVPPALVHLIGRSSPFSGADNIETMGEKRVTVVRSPRSGVNFFSLGDFEAQMAAAYSRAQPALTSVRKRKLAQRQPALEL